MKSYYDHAGITIYHGNCREILPQLPKVDLVLTDPPYGVDVMLHPHNIFVKSRACIGHEYPPIIGNDNEFDPISCINAGCEQILWGANHYAHKLPHLGKWLIWDKRCQQQPSRNQADCEIAWFSKYGAARIFYHVWDGMIKASEHGESRHHPTQKPIALMKWCLGFAPDAQIILDPFMGSGTTLRAAKDLGRKAIGIEIEEKYCEIAAKRLEQEVFDFTPKPTVQLTKELLTL